jgi:lipopolysaccharide/colanic/teichoic acid biosynthesis glycosyltransferase
VEEVLNLQKTRNVRPPNLLPAERVSQESREILDQEPFQRRISLERKRTERSRKPFLLMLMDLGNESPCEKDVSLLGKILKVLTSSTRETDITGWYEQDLVAGVMFTEINLEDRTEIVSTMIGRVSEVLRQNLTVEQFNQVNISFHLFPEDWDGDLSRRPSNPTLYPDVSKRDEDRKMFRTMKRMMDIVGSLTALIFFSPIFLAVAIGIKLSSKGPVLFCQRRVGQHGVCFSFLKFRSMYVDNDATTHKEYIKKLIAGTAEKHLSGENGEGVYKLTRDSRVTRLGSFLRKTSLDELPQFLNVLKGDMSLVGPRPPIAYEVESYDIWHRSRILEAKPGITGLWQVCGRSRVKFDEMVRLDLRYARNWTPWLDIQILMRTPWAVLLGDGAH